MKLPTLRNRWAFYNCRLRPVPIIVASLLLLSIGTRFAAGQPVVMRFTVNPSAPTADQPLAFYFDASSLRGKVVGIAVLAGSGCTPMGMIVTILAVSPPVASGAVSLPSGLAVGQYSAIAFIFTSGTGQSVTETQSCLPFTVY